MPGAGIYALGLEASACLALVSQQARQCYRGLGTQSRAEIDELAATLQREGDKVVAHGIGNAAHTLEHAIQRAAGRLEGAEDAAALALDGEPEGAAQDGPISETPTSLNGFMRPWQDLHEAVLEVKDKAFTWKKNHEDEAGYNEALDRLKSLERDTEKELRQNLQIPWHSWLHETHDSAKALIQQMESDSYEFQYVILTGIQGAGKSTIANGLVGKRTNGPFVSGISMGEGLTRERTSIPHRGNVYVDTPGMSDMSMGADEITAALRETGSFRVIFILNPPTGRIRFDESLSLKNISSALPPQTCVNVVFNMLRKDVYQILKGEQAILEDHPDRLYQAPGLSKIFLALASNEEVRPNSYFLAGEDRQLENLTNAGCMPSGFMQWLEMLERTSLHGNVEEVQALTIEGMHQAKEDLAAAEERFKNDEQSLREELTRLSEMEQSQRDEVARMRESTLAQRLFGWSTARTQHGLISSSDSDDSGSSGSYGNGWEDEYPTMQDLMYQ